MVSKNSIFSTKERERQRWYRGSSQENLVLLTDELPKSTVSGAANDAEGKCLVIAISWGGLRRESDLELMGAVGFAQLGKSAS